MGNNGAVRCVIGMLPDELIIEIVARVGSCSLKDLFRYRQSCKVLKRCGQDSLVLQQSSTQEIYARRFRQEEHREAAYAFLRLCAERGNPGALYGQGLLKYFRAIDEPDGLDCLQRSAALAHSPVAYVLAMVRLCSQEQVQDRRAMNMLRAVRDPSSIGIMECRLEFVRFLYATPPIPRVVLRLKPPIWSTHREPGRCPWRARLPSTSCAFLAREEVDAGSCMPCSCEFKAMFFYSLLYLRRWRF